MPTKADEWSDCVIVGGGVIGLSIAWELLKRGLSCTVVDQGTAGKGCSWAGAGILPPARADTAQDPIDELRGLSHQLHPTWAEELLEITGIDNGYRRCGGIYLATSNGEAAALSGQSAYWDEYQIESFPLSIDELLTREPAISRSFAETALKSAWWVPDEAQIRPPAHLKALLAACRASGCKIIEHSPVSELRQSTAQISPKRQTWLVHCGAVPSGAAPSGAGHSADETMQTKILEAESVVLACGAWASRFTPLIGRIKDVFPVRGQAVLYQAEPGLLRSVINEGHRYLVPRSDGVVYVGSNEEEVGLQEGTTPEVIESLKSWGSLWIPMLQEAPIISTISGLRPSSFDGLPYISKSQSHPGIFVATGHFRSGLHLSCATAVVVADLVTGNVPTFKSLSFTATR